MNREESPPLDTSRLLDLIKQDKENFLPGFAAWLTENLHVWRAFEKEADRVWDKGRRHYSARTIIEFLRHETSLTDTDASLKLNGNAVPDMARLYRLRYPARADLFETRRMPGSRRAA
ncbi:MAG: hypothetical protein ACREO8_10220 [Luteimonas sp.]